jgi:parallel beta-helix repeat protein
VVTINTNTTVCPGIYHGLNLVIAPGTSAITVTGTGVTLNGDGSDRPAFELNTVNQITIEGFNILNYPLGAAVVLLNNAPNNTFQDMTVEAPQNRYAFYIDQSNGNTLRRVTINSHSDVGVYVNLSDQFTMTSSTTTGTPPFDAVTAYGLLTIDGGTGHRIDTSLFTGGSQFGLELYNLTNSMVINNRMLNCAADGIKTSSMRNTTLSGNMVNGNQGWGLNLINGSTPNTMTGNNFTMNTLGPVTSDVSSSTGNTFSGNTPPP